jgi:hypothetical protein
MSYTTDEGLTVTQQTTSVRPGDEAKVLAGAPSGLPGGIGDLLHVVGVLVSDVAEIKAMLGLDTPAPTQTDVKDSGLDVAQTVPPVRPGDEATTGWTDPGDLPPPAPVAEAPAVDPTKDPATVPLGGAAGAATGDASQPAEQDREAAISRMPNWAQDLIHKGEGLVGGV